MNGIMAALNKKENITNFKKLSLGFSRRTLKTEKMT